MAHISGENRSQLLLLPDAVDDYVGPDNPVRFIDAFVDSLDLEAAGFQRVRPNDKGRPGYDPADLLKLYIYGDLNRVRSSRRLEVETHRNLEVIWLLRQLKPDFKTIADFRRDNRNAFRQVFREFVRLCRELDLFGRELIAVDGTRIKAVNNRDRNFTRATLKRELQSIDRRLEQYLQQMNETDAKDDGDGTNDSVAHLQAKIASMRKQKATLEGHGKTLNQSGEAQLSLTDPDSRAMHTSTRVAVGYNAQIAVDTKHNLIAEQQLHSKVSDLGLLAETAIAARENLAVKTIDAVADGGYYKIEDIENCEAAGITPYVSKPDRSTARNSGHFPKSEFCYDAETNTYGCPAGASSATRGQRDRRGEPRRQDLRSCVAAGITSSCFHFALLTGPAASSQRVITKPGPDSADADRSQPHPHSLACNIAACWPLPSIGHRDTLLVETRPSLQGSPDLDERVYRFKEIPPAVNMTRLRLYKARFRFSALRSQQARKGLKWVGILSS